MNDIMNDIKWNYKNFNMVIELEIAGEFIYNGIHEISRLTALSNDGPTFNALYSISVGIERLQKIVYVLWNMDEYSDTEEFEKSLITHSHTGLRDRINQILKDKGEKIAFNERENEFFNVLVSFYNTARYMRFNVEGDSNKEVQILKNFIYKYVPQNNNSPYFNNRIIIDDKVKELFGRVTGSIAQKYYSFVRKGSELNNTYTYELRSDSKAFKVFMGNYNKNSLAAGQMDEKLALKELLIYLRNSKDKDAFFRYIDEIDPLEFDPPMAMEYLHDVINGNITQDLVDEVEYLYGENGYSKDRFQLVNLFAESGVVFDAPIVNECWEIIQKIQNHEIDEEDLEQLEYEKEYFEEEELSSITENIICVSRDYIKNHDQIEFDSSIKKLVNEFEEYVI